MGCAEMEQMCEGVTEPELSDESVLLFFFLFLFFPLFFFPRHFLR